MNTEKLLEVTGLTRVYREGSIETSVLRGIDFSLNAHEMTAVVGASGSGKSTLLHILGTLDAPTAGQVLFRGQDLFRLSESALAVFRNRHLGFVYQFHHLLADFSAFENVAMPLLIAGTPRDEINERVTALLERVGLRDRMHHRSSELSGGERQRVAIARAIVNKPDLLLADEPTGNLDHKSAGSVFDLLLELREEAGSAMMIVTHDRELASRFERVLTMRDGVIQ
ncbi:lipoprotein-releasing ABC transporter ATP-binding protein LolD [Succinimonas sp.]|uniref:lipoprotein-releasing ABC transporter ATP-binding protein LolD n=1 Tax=Succinimonas sp. TaxID=1936151 RepID=UPI00386814E5